MTCFIYVCMILYIRKSYAIATLDHRNVTAEDYINLDNMAGKIVSIDTYFEANNSENTVIAKGCSGTMVYGHLNPRMDTPIYAVVTAGQCCNVKAAIHTSGLELNDYERVMLTKHSTTGTLLRFRALNIKAYVSYGSKFLSHATVMIIKGTLGNQMVTIPDRRIVKGTCSSRLGNEFEYQLGNDFCVIHVDPRIHRKVIPLLTEDNFHHMSNVREGKHHRNCRLIRWNDSVKYRELEELDVEIVESKKCKDALSSYGIVLAPDLMFKSYCIRTPNLFMTGFKKNPFTQLNYPRGKDFADVGTPVVCKTDLGPKRNDLEFILGLATLRVDNYTVVMDGLLIASHLSVQYISKRLINRSYLQRPLGINTYTPYHDLFQPD